MDQHDNGSNGNNDPHLKKLVEDALAKFTAPDNLVTIANSFGKEIFLLIVDRKTKTFSIIPIQSRGKASVPKECLAGMMVVITESQAHLKLALNTTLRGFKEDPLYHKPVSKPGK